MKQPATSKRWLGVALAMQFSLLAAGPPALAQQPGTRLPAATQQAAQLALQASSQWAGVAMPAASFRVASARIEPSGLLYAYLQQLQGGIPVYNRMATLVFKGSVLRHHAGGFLSAKAFAGQPATPTVTAAAALTTALASTGIQNLEVPQAINPASGVEQRQTFEPAGMAHRPIEVYLVWATDKGQPRLAWNVNVDLVASPDWLNIRVDAATGQVLGQDNWTVSERAGHPAAAAARRPAASAGPTWAPQALWHPSGAKSTAAVTSASYRVVPFANERPDVTTPRVDTDPWLRAGASNPVTSYGWHFDGTTNYTDTRGNNVWAYDDSLNQNKPGRYTLSTGTGSGLVFDDVADFTQVPTLGKNRRAATTNLFYWNNLMHDVMYQYGFTEAASNFQTDNQGRGGQGRDYVQAEAQDGKDINNANFSTPPDGYNGRMQMYLWNGITPAYTLNVSVPAAIAGNYAAIESGFSVNNKLANLGPISGQLALYTDAGSSPTNPTYLACGGYGGSTPLAGKIAVLYRGTCSFAPKVKNAQLAGAIAVVVINNSAAAPIVMGGSDDTIIIPAVMVSQAIGATLVNQLSNGVQVTLPKPPATGPQLDGDFDSGIIAHEYGHGISNRLTGGGVNTSCLGNAEQAGEGWSDYFGLMMTTDWTTAQTADGPKARPVGAYAFGQPTTGVGLRRYAYSTDMSVNPLTYANVATNTEVHATGEVWCATLWDMTWNIIQQQGAIEPNLYNSASTGGNAVALNLVMQGLKLQPCQPGFLDGRDAILAADSLLYNGQYHCAIWSAFARRGMGLSAKEGASTSATDQTPAYDQPGVALRKTTTPLAGNQFTITLAASCDCQAQAPVSITDQLPAGLQYVSSTGGTLNGNTVSFTNLSFAKGQRRTFQIVAQTAPGAGCPLTLPVNDDRETNTMGGLTPAVVKAGNAWAPTTTLAHSGTTAWATSDPIVATDVTLTSAPFTPSGFSLLSFQHYFSTESTYDGGMVAISVNNGAWQDAATYFLQNGYNSAFDASTASKGKPCFSGLSSKQTGAAAFQQSLLDLSSFSGQSIRIRFQFQSDDGNPYGALPGWFIDDIQVLSGCGDRQQVKLFNGANTLMSSYAQAIFLTEPLTTWTGAASTDWFAAGNWSGGVPTSALEAIIPAGMPRYPVLSAGTATARALTLNANATLTQTDGTLDVRGTWTNNGTFAASGGTVLLGTNTGAQVVGSSPTRFWNLTTSGNAVDLNTSAGLAIQRLLLTNTSLNANGNPVLLESNASGTAMLASPNAGASLLGTSVTVERYISPGPNAGVGYRHLASPTQGATFGDLATASFSPVVNAAYNTAAKPGSVTPFPTIYAYDQSRLTSTTNDLGSFDKGWVSPTALGDQLTPGLGYTVNLAPSQTVVFKGQPGFGDLVRTLTRNAAGSATDADAGWNLVGNPYASPYDYGQQVAADLVNLDPTIYVYTSSTQYTGAYRAILNGVGGSAVLPMGQGFFMHVASGATSGTLTFRNAQRITSYQSPSFLRTAETRPLVQLSLRAAGSPATTADDAYVYFEQGASDGYEPAFDALKLSNPTGLNLSASLAGRQLAIAGYAPLGAAQRVMPLAVGVPAPGTYTLAAAQLLNLATTPVYLRDLQTGAVINLAQQPSYQFTVSNATALVTGRFELVFSPQQALTTAPAALTQQVALYPNPAQQAAFVELPASLGRQAVSASLVDALGRVVRTVVLPAQGATAHPLDLRGLASGVYALRLTTSAGTIVKRLTVE